jgi:hypothetical protein
VTCARIRKPLSVKGNVAEIHIAVLKTDILSADRAEDVMLNSHKVFEAECKSKGWAPYGEPVVETQLDLFTDEHLLRFSSFVRRRK